VNSRREWSIGVVYRETRPSFSRGHRINQAWESSEEILTFEMIRKSSGDPSERRFCKDDDWRPVYGQKPGRHRGWINNGRISRVSSQQPDPDTGCRGA